MTKKTFIWLLITFVKQLAWYDFLDYVSDQGYSQDDADGLILEVEEDYEP